MRVNHLDCNLYVVTLTEPEQVSVDRFAENLNIEKAVAFELLCAVSESISVVNEVEPFECNTN